MKRIKELVGNSPLHTQGRWLYKSLIYPFADCLGTKSFSRCQFHRVDPTTEEMPAFEILLPGRVDGAPTKGKHEEHVMDAVQEYLPENGVFWEVGARWGYFSLAAAEVAGEVIAFEASENFTKYIHRSIEQNGYGNVRVVQGVVGDDLSLDDFNLADVIVMDIEGWEYEALRSSPETIEAKPTWIIEVHEPTRNRFKHNDIKGLYNLFDKSDYDYKILDNSDHANYHLLATQSING